MKKNEKMKINSCAVIVLLLVLSGYALIFSDIWIIKEGVATGSPYQKFQKQQERQVYQTGQERRLNQAAMDMASDRLE